MNATNPPLEQWQVDHIRKMKQEELGMPQSAPNAEEASMDEEEYTDQSSDDVAVDDTPVASGATGGLGGVSSAPAYASAQKSVTDQINANINLLTAAQNKLRERRAGPSNSEKWLAIAAALGKPTKTGSFGESLGNLSETLLNQQAMKRKAQEERDMLLEQYGLKIGGEQLRMAQANATQAGQLYRADRAAEAARLKALQAKYDPIPGMRGYQVRPGTGGAPPMPEMNQFGNYVITDQRQLTYLPPNTPVVYPGGDQTKPKYTPANPTG